MAKPGSQRRSVTTCFALLLAGAMLVCGSCASAQTPAPATDPVAAGHAAYNRGDYQGALAMWQTALAALESANDPHTAGVFLEIGSAQYSLHDYPKALSAFRNALAHYRALKDALGEAGALNDMGLVQNDLALYDDAAVSLQQALAGYRALDNPLGEANALNNIGNLEENLGHYDRALDALQQALTIHQTLKNQRQVAMTLSNIGNVEEDLGRYAPALASLQQALAIQRDLEDRNGEATDLLNIGVIQQDLGRYDDAFASEEQALVMERALQNRRGEANALGNIGAIEENLGRYDEALASLQQSLAINRALENRLGEANVLTNIGNVQKNLGHYDDALASQQQALAIDRNLKNPLGEANALNNIGNIEENLGRYNDALASQQQALAIQRAIKNPLGEANALSNVGNIEQALGRYDDALASQQQALTIDRALENRLGEANVLTNIGIVDDILGHYDQASAAQQQALAIHRALKSVEGEAGDLGNIAANDERLGRYDDSLTAAREAIALDEQLSDPARLWRSLSISALASAKLGHTKDALADYDAALDTIEALRAGLEREQRTTFLGTTLAIYDGYIAYLLELNRKFPGSGYDRKALEILERKSARATLEQIGHSAAQHFKGVPAALVGQENADAAAIDSARALVATLHSSATSDPAAESAAERRLADARSRAETLESSIRTKYPAYYQLRHPQPLVVRCDQAPCLTISDFQQSVLQPGELVLVYDVLEFQSVLWLIDREHVQLVPLAGSEVIDPAVARVGAHVAGLLAQLAPGAREERKIERSAAADLPEFAADSHALYRMIVPDAAAAAVARAKSLIVVPSGSLYRLAFETLVAKDPANAAQPHYLIEDAPISYIPSASLLAVVRSSYAKATGGRTPLLAFANPTFGAASTGEERGPQTYAGLQLAAARSVARGSAPVTMADAIFPALPGTQTEADAVRAALSASSESLIVGDRATRDRVLSLNASDRLKTYRYLLFATHAVLPSEIEGLTQPAIVLAHPERGDGLLTLADVFGLSLDADFVALSACDTGVPTADSSGEGISGLTRAFLYAGTPAVSVTLWEVDDAAAPQITPPFFAGMHGAKLTAAESLRQAKLAMLNSPQARFRHPYAWGPSVIFGDGDRTPAP